MKAKYLIIACLLVLSAVGHAQSREEKNKHFSHKMGSFTDPRDGKVYKTITFIREHHGAEIRRTWFAENIQFEVPGSKVYNNTTEYGKTYGRLYNYEQANLACGNT